MALRRIASSLISGNLHRPVRSLSAAPSIATKRSFNTNAQMMTRGDDSDNQDIDVDRRSERAFSRRGDMMMPSFFSDVFDPFSTPRSVSQLMNQLVDVPFIMGLGGGPRRSWDAREDENALYLRMDMPGLGKEDVKVSVEENTLIVKGEGEIMPLNNEVEGEGEGEGKRRYSTRIDLTPNLYKVDAIKAEMKNGMLKIVVPKVKEEERKDVFQVQVD